MCVCVSRFVSAACNVGFGAMMMMMMDDIHSNAPSLPLFSLFMGDVRITDTNTPLSVQPVRLNTRGNTPRARTHTHTHDVMEEGGGRAGRRQHTGECELQKKTAREQRETAGRRTHPHDG